MSIPEPVDSIVARSNANSALVLVARPPGGFLRARMLLQPPHQPATDYEHISFSELQPLLVRSALDIFD
jgi:hypothetical protein